MILNLKYLALPLLAWSLLIAGSAYSESSLAEGWQVAQVQVPPRTPPTVRR